MVHRAHEWSRSSAGTAVRRFAEGPERTSSASSELFGREGTGRTASRDPGDWAGFAKRIAHSAGDDCMRWVSAKKRPRGRRNSWRCDKRANLANRCEDDWQRGLRSRSPAPSSFESVDISPGLTARRTRMIMSPNVGSPNLRPRPTEAGESQCYKPA